jgi:AMMECR1 domain-containing protein
LREILDIQEIETGRHGLYTVRGFHLGLLLPQVVSEHRWNRLTFPAETCYNIPSYTSSLAGEGDEGFKFSAEIFCEDDRESYWTSGKIEKYLDKQRYKNYHILFCN